MRHLLISYGFPKWLHQAVASVEVNGAVAAKSKRYDTAPAPRNGGVAQTKWPWGYETYLILEKIRLTTWDGAKTL